MASKSLERNIRPNTTEIAHSFVIPESADSTSAVLPNNLSIMYPDLQFPARFTSFSGWPSASSGYALAIDAAESIGSKVVEVVIEGPQTTSTAGKVWLERVADAPENALFLEDTTRLPLTYLRSDLGTKVNDIWREFAIENKIENHKDWGWRKGFPDGRVIDAIFDHPLFAHIKVIVYRISYKSETLLLSTFRSLDLIQGVSARYDENFIVDLPRK